MTDQCDFCDSKEPRWDYPVRSFTAHMIGEAESKSFVSCGGWLACDACHALIEADDSEGLAARSVDTDPTAQEIPWARPMLLHSVRSLHDGFRRRRFGPATPWEGER